MSNIIALTETDSTNNVLKQMALDGAPSGTVVTADCQTAGKGRLGRSFSSPAGKGIYLSYLMYPKAEAELISTITCWAAVATVNAISSVCGITPSIKWVNDLQINGMKICGILTEKVNDAVIIGIGINVNEAPADFPEQIRDIASSIRLETGNNKDLPREAIVTALIKELDKINNSFPEARNEYLESYRAYCSTVGLDVSVVSAHNHTEEVPRLGKAVAIEDDFSLRVLFEDGHEESLSSGEVSVRRR
ncbi:MAG: biotin--[acetyl-CoA-carboxylase] ligase [Saccharofermentans sp.]|nr:biotin--[acetyl-CoA-carboxylase] ligase [Saccharofermentans sp.]